VINRKSRGRTKAKETKQKRQTEPSCSTHHPSPPEDFLKVLGAQGFRKSKKREAVLKLLSRASRPLSVDEILKGLASLKIDRVSLYRMLAAFEEAHLIFSHDLGDRIKRFELSHDGHHHHHIVCRRCRRIDPLPDCAIGELPRSTQRSIQGYGYSSVSHSLEFFGICSSCSSS